MRFSMVQLRKYNCTSALYMHWINATNECDVRTVRNMISIGISTHSHTKRFCLHPINFYCFVASYLTLIVLQIVYDGDYRRVPFVHTTSVCVNANAPPRLACLLVVCVFFSAQLVSSLIQTIFSQKLQAKRFGRQLIWESERDMSEPNHKEKWAKHWKELLTT